ncbi:PREDICTED: protein CutA 1, chloroplastic-like isoform X2 [Lupinus angustifolius]|uniref:protein CutA 1, chloroplastic-like isoform X2 n=1 Tax=Lupinus angustifolius TaxID=3871 RepID=UPI00092E417D|nr:PREDICTED: protein CutA 1, chloroplastic-like isoform X2 [Lupinus angustifolius]
MASTSTLSFCTLRRRLPLVGAFCMLTLGLSNLRTGSKLGYSTNTVQSHSIRMEANNNTVPSIVVYVTVPNKESGKKLAESIVKEKLAACVNRVPGIESVYQWKGEIQTDSEELLIIKTRQSLLEALTEHVKANHEYDVPEVISLPINGGNLKYLEWIKESTRE